MAEYEKKVRDILKANGCKDMERETMIFGSAL